jgi:hypothetical protein
MRLLDFRLARWGIAFWMAVATVVRFEFGGIALRAKGH